MKKVTIKTTRVDENPNMPDMPQGSDHWQCTLTRDGRQMSVIFSKGPGHGGSPPTADEVMECLCSDAAIIENSGGSFIDFCYELGFDADSRRAERCWKAVRKQTEKLRKFLGDDYESVIFQSQD